ncbi:MAG: DUF1638 domain-containing protein [Candidatus Riflebacteria bacterium]|nr:DUF1638 domain-containing protein [Candidatus Riflebacteria bacterium]
MKDFHIITCSILQRETEKILKDDECFSGIGLSAIDSMLHLHPEKLHQEMKKYISELSGKNIVLVYGDCHPFIKDIEKNFRCRKLKGHNCVELILGEEPYKNYMKNEPLFLLPEWLPRWREIFQNEFGFKSTSCARAFMHDFRKILLYIDTGLIPIPKTDIHDISVFLETPVQIISAPLISLKQNIINALKEERSPPDDS